ASYFFGCLMSVKPKQNIPRLIAVIFISLVAWIIFSTAMPSVNALTIIRKYIPPGEQFEFDGIRVTAGHAPKNTVGAGNLVEVFDAAADSWERAIKDEHTVTIQFGWSPIPVGNGVHNVRFQTGIPNRVTEAIVYVDNDGSTRWFLDPTPQEHSEYQTVIECFVALGGGPVNSGYVLSGHSASAQALDLLTIAKHEIGHSIALSTWNYLWVTKQADRGILVNPPRPFSGSLIPVNSGGHLRLLGALMDSSLLPGQRKHISVVDVLAIAEVGEFIDLNLDPETNPIANSDLDKEKARPGCG
ncbi:MAG: hypothetical protein JSU59_04235, partial [Nitrospirota bacterium]